MWSQTLAFFWLGVRESVRSRFLASLAAALLVVAVGLPLGIEGDGTLTGQARMTLLYTLGMASTLLAAATLWASCGAISREIEDRQIQMTAVKPTPRVLIWLGRWLSLVSINALVLGFTGLMVYGMLQWNVRRQAPSEERRALFGEALAGRRQVRPLPESFEADVSAELARLRAQGQIPPPGVDGGGEFLALAQVRKQVTASQAVVAPGASKQWMLRLPRSVTVAARRPSTRAQADAEGLPDAWIRFRLAATVWDRKPVTGTVYMGTVRDPRLADFRITQNLESAHRFQVPAAVLVAAAGEAEHHLQVTFANGDRDASATVVFDQEDDLDLLVTEGGFGMNLVRSLLVIFFYMALLAALGLTAGTFLTFPVATFVACCALVMAFLGHYVTFANAPEQLAGQHRHGLTESSYLEELGQVLIERVEVITGPILQFGPLGNLSEGILVSWSLTGRALWLLGCVYPFFLGCLGTYFLTRRELGLPA